MWISRYIRDHRLYALAVTQLFDRLVGRIYTGARGGTSNILQSFLKLLLLMTVGTGMLFSLHCLLMS
jgi:hypothetical protein